MLGVELVNAHMGLIYYLNKNPKESFQLATELEMFNSERKKLKKIYLMQF